MLTRLHLNTVKSAFARSHIPVLTTQQRYKTEKPDRRLNDPYENETPQEQDKIKEFLTPLGLEQYAEKFTSWDHMMNLGSYALKHKFGMSCQERKLLRKQANNWRLIQYYTTGKPYQYRYDLRDPLKPFSTSRREDSSEDELTFLLPNNEGFVQSHLHYPGARRKHNKLLFEFTEEEWQNPIKQSPLDQRATSAILKHPDVRARHYAAKEILARAAVYDGTQKPFSPDAYYRKFTEMIEAEKEEKLNNRADED